MLTPSRVVYTAVFAAAGSLTLATPTRAEFDVLVWDNQLVPAGDQRYNFQPNPNATRVSLSDDYALFSADWKTVFPGSGIYRASESSLIEIARYQDPITGGSIDSSVGSGVVNDAGQVAFTPRVNPSSDYAVVMGDGLGLDLALREGDPIPGGDGNYFRPGWSVPVAVNNVGQIAVSANVFNTPNTRAIIRWNGPFVPMTKIVQNGDAAPGGDGTLNIGPGTINDAGQVAFAATISNSSVSFDEGIFRSDGSQSVTIARKNTPLPLGGVVNDISPVTNVPINNAGQVAFRADLETGAIGVEPAAVLIGDGGTLTEVTRGGQWIGNGWMRSIDRHVDLNDQGQAVFTASITPFESGASYGDNALFIGGDQRVPRTIARASEPTGYGSDVYSGLSGRRFAINNRGEVAYLAAVDTQGTPNSGADDVAGLFLYSPDRGSKPFKIAQVGDAYDGSVITQLGFSGTSASNGHIPHEASGLNHRGQVAFSFELADNRGGIAAWTPDPPDKLVILTHGYQPGGNLVGLPGIRNALQDKIDNLADPFDVQLIEFKWDEAVVDGVIVFDGIIPEETYWDVKNQTSRAGLRLAFQINTYIEELRELHPGYDPELHFIGHSLGTVVNAEAVAALDEPTVEQFTIIDSPLQPGPDASPLSLVCHEAYFYQQLAEGKVQSVDNYIATVQPIFGQKIDGAGPTYGGSSGGVLVPGHAHVGYEILGVTVPGIDQFYAELIAGTQTALPGLDWNSPILPGWAPNPAWNHNPFACVVDTLRALSPILSVLDGQVTVLEPQTDYQLITASPASIGTTEDAISDDLALIGFDYEFIAGEGELSLWIGDILVWQLDSETAGLGEPGSALVPVDYFAGQTASIRWVLEPLGELPATANITEIAFLGVSVAGDLSGDGDVDDEDLGLFFSAFTGPDNGPSSNPAADLSGDGDVDDEDLGVAFSAFTGPLAPINIPEPATSLLLALGGLLAGRRRRVRDTYTSRTA